MSSRSGPEVARRQHWEPHSNGSILAPFLLPPALARPSRPAARLDRPHGAVERPPPLAGNDRLFRRHDRPLRRKPEPRRNQGGQRHERSRAVADRVGPGHRSDARRRSRIASGRTRRRGHEPIPQGDRSRLLEHGRDHRQPAAGGDGECRRQARPGPALTGLTDTAPGALWNRSHPQYWRLAGPWDPPDGVASPATEMILNDFIHRQSFVDQGWAGSTRLRPGDWLRPRGGRTDWHRIASRLDYGPRLGSIGIPTLILCGRHDPQYAPACSEELAAGIRDAGGPVRAERL